MTQTVILTQPVRVGGSVLAAGTTQSLALDVAADLIQRGFAMPVGIPVWQSPPQTIRDSAYDLLSIAPPAALHLPSSLISLRAIRTNGIWGANIKPEDLIDTSQYINTFYVDGDAGVDSQSGTSWATRKQSIMAAYLAAQAADAPARIYVKGDTALPYYRALSFCPGQYESCQGAYPVIFEAVDGRVVTGPFLNNSFSKVSNHYEATSAAACRCVNTRIKDQWGMHIEYKWVASSAAVDAERGTWFTDGTTVYVRTHDDSPADIFSARIYHGLTGAFIGLQWRTTASLFMRGFDLEGGSSGNMRLDSSADTGVIILDDCTFRFSSASNLNSGGTDVANSVLIDGTAGPEIFAAFNCDFSASQRDGLNVSPSSSITFSLAVNCRGVSNGSADGPSNQGFTLHYGLHGASIGGTWLGNDGGGGGHAHSGTTVWHAGDIGGKTFGDFLGGGTRPGYGFAAIDQAVVYVDYCRDVGAEYGLYIPDTGTIYAANHVGVGKRSAGVVYRVPQAAAVVDSGAAFDPLSLFSGASGAWYDPSDLTTLFQNSAGTTAVTAAGNPIGLMRDKSGGGNHALQATSGLRPLLNLTSSTVGLEACHSYRLKHDMSDDTLLWQGPTGDYYVANVNVSGIQFYAAKITNGSGIPISDTMGMILLNRAFTSDEKEHIRGYFGAKRNGLPSGMLFENNSTTYTGRGSVLGSGVQSLRFGDGTAYTTSFTGTETTANRESINYDVSVKAGLTAFYWHTNSVTGSIPDLSAYTGITRLRCYTNQLTGAIPDLSANTGLLEVSCYDNKLTGAIPDLSANTALTDFNCNTNQLTGSIPSLAANTQLQNFFCHLNQLTGAIPSLTLNTALAAFYCYDNQLTGAIPDLSANTSLTVFRCYNNQLSSWAGGTVSITLGEFRADGNALNVASINALLAAFVAANKTTGTRTLNLSGGTNAAPTGQGITDKATLVSRGWTVTTN